MLEIGEAVASGSGGGVLHSRGTKRGTVPSAQLPKRTIALHAER